MTSAVKTLFEMAVQPLVSRFAVRFGLSKRESQASILLAEGMRPKEIAQYMACSEKTVYAHLARVCRKTSCRDYHEVLCMLLIFVYCECRNKTLTSAELRIPDHVNGSV